jgi:hypothetical protein
MLLTGIGMLGWRLQRSRRTRKWPA